MLDVPGQMLKLTKLLTDLDISFSQIVQTKNTAEYAYVAIITHEMNHFTIPKLSKAIGNLRDINLIGAYKVIN